jgi:proline dehydrogenase
MCWYKPFLKPLAFRFIAGETLREALPYGLRVQRQGLTPIFDILGEGATNKEDSVRVSSEYIHLLEEMKRNHLRGGISLKLTAFALDEDEETCFRAVSRIVRHAQQSKTIVWIDMEGNGYASKTLKMYRRLLEEFDNVGVCLQAYLKRTHKDILSLLPDNPKIRLVKGAYVQPDNVAYTKHEEINAHFKKLLTLLSDNDVYTAVGTHDMDIISHALTLPFPTHFEFQMLKGFRKYEKKLLSEHGYNVSEYIPYGKSWEKFIIRRIQERMRSLRWLLMTIAGMDK